MPASSTYQATSSEQVRKEQRDMTPKKVREATTRMDRKPPGSSGSDVSRSSKTGERRQRGRIGTIKALLSEGNDRQTTVSPPGEPVARKKSRSRSRRLSSGEMLKNIFDTGVQGIRKMSRRVTGGGAGGGSIETEEL